LLLDTELFQARDWLLRSAGKEPTPTHLHHEYIAASEKRTRQLRNIRRASFVGTFVAIIAFVFAAVASYAGYQASTNADLANTREAAANGLSTHAFEQAEVANAQATTINATLTPLFPTLNAAGTQIADSSTSRSVPKLTTVAPL